MDYILDLFLKHIVSEECIKEEELDIYRFGLECMILKLIHYVSYIIIAIVLHSLPGLLLSSCVMIPLRSKAGGYHAKTRIGCYVFSCSMITALCLLNRMVLPEFIHMVILVIANIIILVWAPVENENRPLEQVEINVFRKRVIITLLIADAIIFVMIWQNASMYNFLINGIVMMSILLTLEKAKEWKCFSDNLDGT